MTILEQVISAARAELAEGWTQGTAFRDADGVPTGAFGACSRCIYGAVGLAPVYLGRTSIPEAEKAWAYLREVSGIEDLIRWNDTEGRTQADVLNLLDKALEGLRA